jgi:hypothetical protein
MQSPTRHNHVHNVDIPNVHYQEDQAESPSDRPGNNIRTVVSTAVRGEPQKKESEDSHSIRTVLHWLPTMPRDMPQNY